MCQCCVLTHFHYSGVINHYSNVCSFPTLGLFVITQNTRIVSLAWFSAGCVCCCLFTCSTRYTLLCLRGACVRASVHPCVCARICVCMPIFPFRNNTVLLHCTALHCTALHCTALHCPALPCPALPCPALPCPALPCPALPCPALPCTALHCTALHCTALHCTALHCTALHCTALHCTALHCTALHCTALHCTALHCTALHWVAWRGVAWRRVASRGVASRGVAWRGIDTLVHTMTIARDCAPVRACVCACELVCA